MILKVLHTSDNHIGETAYSKRDSVTGLNARGMDFLRSFQGICSKALENNVDVFVIAGDLFSKVNPHPRFIYEVLSSLYKLCSEGVVTIIVSGNHEAPKLATTLNPLKLLEHLPNIHCVNRPRTINVKGIDFVCVPSPSNFDEIRRLFKPMVQVALKESKFERKVLVSHLPVTGASLGSEQTLEFFTGETVDTALIPSEFVYVALGHVHSFQRLKDSRMPIYYSGSSERYDFREEDEEKYCILVDILEDSSVNVTPIELDVRDMTTIIDQECSGLNALEITSMVLEEVKRKSGQVKDALVRVKLENIHIDESRNIDWTSIRNALEDAGAFEIRFQHRTTVPAITQEQFKGEYLFPPSRELELYLQDERYSDNRATLLQIGKEVIEETEERLKVEA